MKSSLKILMVLFVRVLAVGIVCLVLYLIGLQYFLRWQYPQYQMENLQAATAGPFIQSGYLPSWLPEDAENLHLQIGLEKNMAWWLRFDTDHPDLVIQHLQFKPFDGLDVMVELPDNNYFFFNQQTESIQFFEGPLITDAKKEYLAVKDHTIYYWVQ